MEQGIGNGDIEQGEEEVEKGRGGGSVCTALECPHLLHNSCPCPTVAIPHHKV